MAAVVVLVIVAAIVIFVFYWSGRYGDKNRSSGTSLHRGAHAHTTRNGRPKKAYATRDEAQAQAQLLTKRNGAPMGAYKCGTCGKWHVGHD
jgi:uncharacterized membrane protein